MADLIIGIDFGTCNIKIAKWNHKKKKSVRVHLDSDQSNSDYMIPNVIEYRKTEEEEIEKVIGDEALNSFDMENVIEHIKYHLQRGAWEQFVPSLGDKVDAMEVLKDIFQYLKDAIEEQNGGREIKGAVITTPVCYCEIQKQRIITAAQNAGIPITDVITEPVAALFSFDKYFEEDSEKNILIFDFGGATLDLSLINIKGAGTGKCVAVLASEGMNYGGIDINHAIYEQIFLKKYPELIWVENHDEVKELKKDILRTIEKMKRTVYRSEDGYVEREWRPYTGEDFVIVLKLELNEFISLLKLNNLNRKIVNLLNELIQQGNISKNDVTNVCMVGGTARIKFFRDTLEKYFPEDIFEDLEDDEMYSAVSEGAVKYLNLINESTISFTNRISYDVGIADSNKKFCAVLRKSARFGMKSRKRPAVFENGRMNIYQMFVKNEELDVDSSEDVVYMGYFEADISKYSDEKNIRFEIYANKKGKLMADFYDGKKKTDTLELIVGC